MKDMLEKLLDQIDTCVSDAYIKFKQINKLMLCGGMGHSTVVQEALRQHFESYPNIEIVFDEGTAGCESYIAYGAAAVAKNIATESWRAYYVSDEEDEENEENEEDKDSFRSDDDLDLEDEDMPQQEA